MKKSDITGLMLNHTGNDLIKALNDFISPQKVIQAHKGCHFGKITGTSEGYWSSINFPQWVNLEDESGKSYRFTCDIDGNFIKW